MSEIVLGIDFGSSNTFITRKDVGLVLKEPTLICATMTNNGYTVKSLGQEAKEMQGKTDDRTVIFCPISQGEIKSEEYATLLLKSFVEKAIGTKSLFSKLKIIITVPTGITSAEKQKYIDICKKIGAKEVIAIPKIICSAYGCDINICANNANLVVDIGGGTVDVAVINLNSIIEGATLAIGGKGMDTSICDLIKSKYGVEIGILSANKLKEEIGSLFENDNANMEVCGVDIYSKLPASLQIFASDVQQAILPFMEEIVRLIETTINIMPPEISADVVRNGLWVCGGFSCIPGLQKFLRNALKIKVNISDDSENACIIGVSKLINHVDIFEKVLAEI